MTLADLNQLILKTDDNKHYLSTNNQYFGPISTKKLNMIVNFGNLYFSIFTMLIPGCIFIVSFYTHWKFIL